MARRDLHHRDSAELLTASNMQGMSIQCLIATLGEGDEAMLQAVRQQGDPSCQLPAGGGKPPRVVVASLDLNRGS